MRILVVEDERKIATFIQKGLRECGFVVDIVHRGDAARYRVEDLTLDLATRIVRRGNRPIELTTREFSLLECLMRALGKVFTRTQLCQRVSISLTDIGSFALFRISNTGMEIPEEHEGRIFERFYRADPSRSSATVGSGLGLSICREIVLAHGGEIRFERPSTGLTTFTVTLPKDCTSKKGLCL